MYTSHSFFFLITRLTFFNNFSPYNFLVTIKYAPLNDLLCYVLGFLFCPGLSFIGMKMIFLYTFCDHLVVFILFVMYISAKQKVYRFYDSLLIVLL